MRESISTLGIVGAGAMGQGIAQVAAHCGLTVIMFDVTKGAAEAGRVKVVQRLERLAAKGNAGISQADVSKATKRLRIAGNYADFAACDVVIEAVVEQLPVKQTVLVELEKVVREDAILASNTSSLSIGEIAQVCRRRDRVAGMHFFNPVPLMKLVEIIRGSESSDATLAALSSLAVRLKCTPIEVKDSPGFLVNLGGRALNTEALAIVHEQVAECAQVDAILRDCCGFRMGPFELMDLTGIDVNFPVTQIVWNGYFNDPRLRSTPYHASLFRSGRLGRKTGSGYYEYQDGRTVLTKTETATSDELPAGVVLVDGESLPRTLCEVAGIPILTRDDGRAPIFAALWGEDCTEAAVRLDVDYRRLVAVDPSGNTDARVTLMTAPGADRNIAAAVAAICCKAGRKVSVIADSPGFVAQRVCVMVMNLSCEMAQIGLADPASIDKALQLGLNYPLGPLAMVDSWGADRVYQVISTIQRITGDDRYRPSQWLRRRAKLGLSALATA